MRAITGLEQDVLSRLLSVDFPGVEQLRSQAEHILGVESSCSCGCPSIKVFPDRDAVPRADCGSMILPVSLLEIERPDGVVREVIVFADQDGYLAEVECVYFDQARHEWPDLTRCALYLDSAKGGTAAVILPNGVTFVPVKEGDAWRRTALRERVFSGVTVAGYVEEFDLEGRVLRRVRSLRRWWRRGLT